MNTQRIPLEQLQVAPGNVRKTGGIPIYKLASSILAHGLLQNLVVSPDGDKFLVVAGGRRLQALQSLAKQGDLPAGFEVTCNVLGAVSAHEASLAENVAREAMHPVDEFHAFKQLVDEEKLTTTEIADRFGCVERHVEQRLRLANVAPAILAEYRDGKATLEQMQALALVDDHKAQLAAWGSGKDRMPNDWSRQPKQLREALTAKEVAVDSPLGKLVTVEAYVAAGGKLREDLFVDYGTMPDGKLVERLAREKLQGEADKLIAKGWGWVEVRTSEPDYSERNKYRQQHGAKPDAKLGAIVYLSRYNGIEKLTGLVKPGAKAPPQKKTTPKAGKGAAALSREEEGHLQALRTVAVRNGLRECRWTTLALVAASLAAELFASSRASIDTVIGVSSPTTSDWMPAAKETKKLDTKSGRLSWQVRIEAGAKKQGGILAWLLSQDEKVSVDLIAFCAIEGFLADDDVGDQVHQLAPLIEVDLAEGWKLTADWLAKQSKGYVLAELERAGAQTKALAKLSAKDLAKAALPLLQAANWLPGPLRAPKPKVAKSTTKPAKKATKKAAKKAA